MFGGGLGFRVRVYVFEVVIKVGLVLRVLD